jgi:hypothetical protein
MNRLQKDPGKLGESVGADLYGYSMTRASNFDMARESGAVAEAKSCASRLESGNRGRFRLWKQQHDQLTRQDRNGSAFYVFILFDVSSRPVEAKGIRKKPAEVGRIIGARGGWNDSGHHQGPQRKLPWSLFFGGS